ERNRTEPQTELLQYLKDQGPLREADADASPTVDGGADDAVHDLLGQWDEYHRRGQEPPPGWPALTDPARLDDLLRRIEPRKRPYALVDAAGGDVRSVPTSSSYPVIAGFRILREIGRGGMGIVYEAEQEVLSRRVALKVLPPHAPVHPRQIHRFEREAKSAAQLHHTNIVPVFGVGNQDGYYYYVMQYIEGWGLYGVRHELRRRHHQGLGPAITAHGAWSPDRPRPADPDPVEDPGHLKPAAAGVADSLVSGRFGQLEPV